MAPAAHGGWAVIRRSQTRTDYRTVPILLYMEGEGQDPAISAVIVIPTKIHCADGRHMGGATFSVLTPAGPVPVFSLGEEALDELIAQLQTARARTGAS